MDIDFYYDIVCPYAYIASTQVEALAARTGARLRWRPVLLGGIFQAHDAPQRPGDVMGPAKARLNLLDIERYAHHHGVSLKMPEGHPRRTVDAMRLILAAPDAARPALSHALFAAYWVEGRDVADRAVLTEIAAAHGVPISAIDGPDIRAGLRAVSAAAAEAGVFGVPSFRVGDRLWWGQDRMMLVESALRRGGGGPTLTFFHDFASPFSYLASTQVARIARQRGIELIYKPMLLGALFRSIGTVNVPMQAMSPVKAAYAAQDLQDWAYHWGVPLRWPSVFPLRTVAPLRVALQRPELTDALYAAAWAEDRDIGDPEILAAVIREAGGPVETLMAGTQSPEIKAALKANTEEAEAIGACGAPTLMVQAPDGEREIFWGQDRLPLVEATLDRMMGITT